MSNEVHRGRLIPVGLLVASLAPVIAPVAGQTADGIGHTRETFVDASRPTKASPPYPGAPDRRLDTWIWYPAEGDAAAPVPDAPARADGPWPLVVYSHGTYGRPDNATHFIGQPPQCAERRPLIDPARQKAITRHALLAFFDAYLKDDAGALARLAAIDETFADVTLRQELAAP